MAHDALMATSSTGIPFFKVIVLTLAISHARKVKEDDDMLSLWLGVFPCKGTNEDKLLRGRVGDGR